MSVKLPLADPSFPQLQVAGDPESMRGVFQKYLRPLNNKAYHVRDCCLSRIRYRRGNRCVLQYTLRLAEADTDPPPLDRGTNARAQASASRPVRTGQLAHRRMECRTG
jgi:hypothetical protein